MNVGEKRTDARGNIWQITRGGDLYMALMVCPPSKNWPLDRDDGGFPGYTMAWFGHEDKSVVEAQLEDSFRISATREAGCTRVCGNIPNGPVCTKCHINLHAGKWGNGERDLHFGYGQNWREIMEKMSRVHGWIKPGGVK